MDKHLAKRLNSVLYSEYWKYFEEYLNQELTRAYIKFDKINELKQFAAVQAEIKVLKQLLNLKETTRHSLEN